MAYFIDKIEIDPGRNLFRLLNEDFIRSRFNGRILTGETPKESVQIYLFLKKPRFLVNLNSYVWKITLEKRWRLDQSSSFDFMTRLLHTQIPLWNMDSNYNFFKREKEKFEGYLFYYFHRKYLSLVFPNIWVLAFRQ